MSGDCSLLPFIDPSFDCGSGCQTSGLWFLFQNTPETVAIQKDILGTWGKESQKVTSSRCLSSQASNDTLPNYLDSSKVPYLQCFGNHANMSTFPLNCLCKTTTQKRPRPSGEQGVPRPKNMVGLRQGYIGYIQKRPAYNRGFL